MPPPPRPPPEPDPCCAQRLAVMAVDFGLWSQRASVGFARRVAGTQSARRCSCFRASWTQRKVSAPRRHSRDSASQGAGANARGKTRAGEGRLHNDSLDLIRIFEEKRFESQGRVILTSADVNALYPSIRLERGMAALSGFINSHTRFSQTLKDLCLKLAHFVLTNNYVECKELGGTMYQQVVGPAMGTSFSAKYAVIFMIWLETPIVDSERFRSCIQLYKRFIDDLFVDWTAR